MADDKALTPEQIRALKNARIRARLGLDVRDDDEDSEDLGYIHTRKQSPDDALNIEADKESATQRSVSDGSKQPRAGRGKPGK